MGGIQRVQLGQVHEVFETGRTVVPPPKTGEKYVHQPVIFSPLCQEMLSFFLDSIRPYVERVFPSTLEADSFLWASAKCEGVVVDISSQIEKLFLGAGLDTNTTLLRTLMNTECQELLDEGTYRFTNF